MLEESNITNASRKGLIALLLGFVGFMLWASLVAMDRGVVVSGTLTFQGERKTIVHPHGGVIEKIWVNEGQLVEKGQTLISLNTTDSQAQLNSLEVQRQALLAKMKRLRIESRSAKNVKVALVNSAPAEVNIPSSFQTLQQEAETQLFETRQRALQNQINTLGVEIGTAHNSLLALQTTQSSKQRQLQSLNQQQSGLSDMVAKGYMPANRLVEVQGQITSLQVTLAQDQIQISQLRGQTSQARLKMQQLHNQQQAESQTLLNDVQTELANLDEQLHRIEFIRQHTNIQSPVAGQVLGLQLFTQGSAMPANTAVMDIAPSQGQLEISAQLEPGLVDQLKAGQLVTVRFSALKTAQTLEVQGSLHNIGADQLSDPSTGIAHIPVKVRFTEKALGQIAIHRIQAGVPAELLIVTGEQTLMQYLFKPVTDRLFTAMTEH